MDLTKLFMVTVFCSLLLFQVITCQFADFPSLFNEYPSVLQAARDPRENRGPVVFPSAPIPPDTSGVRVGASGFGFYPAGAPRGPVLGALGGPHAEDFPFW